MTLMRTLALSAKEPSEAMKITLYVESIWVLSGVNLKRPLPLALS
jgi:hypothetical protein